MSPTQITVNLALEEGLNIGVSLEGEANGGMSRVEHLSQVVPDQELQTAVMGIKRIAPVSMAHLCR